MQQEISNEQQWLRRAQSGDFQAFSALVERYQERILRLARRIVGSLHDAEDVVQQTFLSAIESLDSYRAEASVSTWLFRIATNHALKVLRKRRGLPLEVGSNGLGEESYSDLPHPDYVASWRDRPDELLQQAEVRQLLDEAIAELPENYRVVFVLRDIEGLSIREVADVLSLSEANVKIRQLRARLQLRERLTRTLGDESTRVYPHQHHLSQDAA